VDRFFQFSLLGLVDSGYLAVAWVRHTGPGRPLVLTAAGLLLRGFMIRPLPLDSTNEATRYATLQLHRASICWILFCFARVPDGDSDTWCFSLRVEDLPAEVDPAAIPSVPGRDRVLEILAAAALSVNFHFLPVPLRVTCCFAICAAYGGELGAGLREGKNNGLEQAGGDSIKGWRCSPSRSPSALLTLTGGHLFISARTRPREATHFHG